MTLDYGSLLLAVAVSAICSAAMFLMSWLGRRDDTFLRSCAIGLILIVMGIVVYGFYVKNGELWCLGIGFSLLVMGFAAIAGAAEQFRFGRFSIRRYLVYVGFGLLASQPFLFFGYDGLTMIGNNLSSCVLLLITAWHYFRARAEAPAPLLTMSILYLATAASFLNCGVVLAIAGKLTLGQAPDNWAEDINIIVCAAGMTGICALSLALHHWQQASLHRRAAMTDPLTGLLNRRAVYTLFENRQLQSSDAVIVIDLDHFKSINDTHGHGVGDMVLADFARILLGCLRRNDIPVRLGGEEFAVVLENVDAAQARMVAERIRGRLERSDFTAEGLIVKVTASVGVAFGEAPGSAFDEVSRRADKALYAAKAAGRNRVIAMVEGRPLPNLAVVA